MLKATMKRLAVYNQESRQEQIDSRNRPHSLPAAIELRGSGHRDPALEYWHISARVAGRIISLAGKGSLLPAQVRRVTAGVALKVYRFHSAYCEHAIASGL